jgi:uncharacterized pyridoxal phosphate-containing UPF0001 family protein
MRSFALAASRPADEVRLLAVSKTFSAADVIAAADAGQSALARTICRRRWKSRLPSPRNARI